MSFGRNYDPEAAFAQLRERPEPVPFVAQKTIQCDECGRLCSFDEDAAKALRAAGAIITCERHLEPDGWTARRGKVFATLPEGWRSEATR